MTQVVVIGGGIAGVSVAHALLDRPDPPSVVLVEAEARLAHHSTGRSAALFVENLGAGPIRALTRASRSFFDSPPDGLVDSPLLAARPLILVGDGDQDAAFDAELADARVPGGYEPSLIEISPERAVALFPALRPERVHRALLESVASEIDVAATHQAFVRGIRRQGGEVRTTWRVDAAAPDGGGWRVETTEGSIVADVVVNAAGAWGDVVANEAGVAPVGLQPLRRTAFMVPAPGPESMGWAFVADVEHRWYVKPDGVHFLCSPGDETPSPPCDARPEEVDIAAAIERVNAATTLGIRSVASSWAGLRTFSPDRSMVIGPDPEHPTFVWCVGQGGTGIQSAPAAGRLTADLLLDGRPGPSFDGVDPDLPGLLPDRFR